MKKMNFILFLALITFILFSCEKDLFDYRNKYLGHWIFVSKKTVDYADTSKVDIIESNTYRGTIKYGEEDNSLLLQYTETNQISIGVNKDGIITSSYPDFYFGHASGEFETRKKLNLLWWNYVRMTNPNMNISTTIEMTGEKN
jgi:hypothetical protein